MHHAGGVALLARCSRTRYATTSTGTSEQREQPERRAEAHFGLFRRKIASSRSQSPDVVSTTWRTPSDASVCARPRTLGGGGLGEAAAELRVARVDAQLAPGLGVDEPELARVRQLLLARVADLDGDDVVAAGELEHRPAPVVRAAEVRDEHDERALARERVGAPDRLAERRRADALVGLRRVLAERRRAARSGRAAPAGRAPSAGRRVAERDDAEPVAAARRDVADRDRDALRDVGLAPFGRAELHRRRRVEHEPRHEHALGVLHANVRLAGPRGDVPVDLADVVAEGVRPDLRELAAVAEERER